MAVIVPLTLVFGLLGRRGDPRDRRRPDARLVRASSDAPPSRLPSVPSSVNSPRSCCSSARSTAFSTSAPHAAPTPHPPSRRLRPSSTARARHVPHSTPRWTTPAVSATKRLSSRAVSTTPRRPARRPTSPACPARGPKHERRRTFSRTPSVSWTTPWPTATAWHPGSTPRSPHVSRRCSRRARPR